MRIIITLLLFLSQSSVIGQLDTALIKDMNSCYWNLISMSEYPYYNSVEINTNKNEINIFLLFYKIDTALYENQTISVSIDDYKNQLKQINIPSKYFNIDPVIDLISLLLKNNFTKIEFKGIGDCTSCAILFTKNKDGYMAFDWNGHCKEWCNFEPKSKKDEIIANGLLHISNLKKYFKN